VRLSKHRIQRPSLHQASGAYGEHCRDGDPASLIGIQEIPGGYDHSLGVTQQVEWNEQFRLQQGGAPGRVNRNSRDIEPCLVNGIQVIPEIRQLANAEWSPMAPVEHQDRRPLLD
jgi:hypothetical protein